MNVFLVVTGSVEPVGSVTVKLVFDQNKMFRNRFGHLNLILIII